MSGPVAATPAELEAAAELAHLEHELDQAAELEAELADSSAPVNAPLDQGPAVDAPPAPALNASESELAEHRATIRRLEYEAEIAAREAKEKEEARKKRNRDNTANWRIRKKEREEKTAERDEAREERAEESEWEGTIRDDLAEGLHFLTEAFHAAFLNYGDPKFGEERARHLAERWAPVIAPYCKTKQDWLAYSKVILAVGCTFLAGKEWVEEVRDHRGPAAGPRVVDATFSESA